MNRKRLRIVVPMHVDLIPPESTEGLSCEQIQPWKTEYDVVSTLSNMGHEVFPVGLYDELNVLKVQLLSRRPHVAFNLLEEFHGSALLDQHIVSFLELCQVPYTGCNPRGLTLAHDKALTKKILAYDGVKVPRFAVFPIRGKAERSPGLQFPLFVKSLTEEGSVGIGQSSIVNTEKALRERVRLIHRQAETPAIAEEYIEGREIYVGVIGNQRLQVTTPWELVMTKLRKGAPLIATDRVKWDYAYQQKTGVETRPAKLAVRQVKELGELSKKIYRSLCLSGYARLDFRMDKKGNFYLLEANPNPNLSYGEDFAEAAEHAGIGYEELLHRIIVLGRSAG